MRIAYFTPLTPTRSGIATYSEQLLPHLARLADVDVYIDDGSPGNPPIADGFAVRGHREFEERSGDYDLTVYQMGNYAPYHRFMYDVLLRHPGVVVLHDCVYFHFYRGLTLSQGDCEGFRSVMRYCYGEAGIREAERVISGGDDHFHYSLVRKIADAGVGVIVHSAQAQEIVAAEAPGTRVRVIPMGVQPGPLPDAERIRRTRGRYGIEAAAFLVGSFGMVTPHKRIDVALRAFARFRRENPRARYIIVGESSAEYTVRGVVRGLGIESAVVMTGHLGEAEFADCLGSVDLCVSLRYPTAGETSLSVLRAMEAGRPVAVSNYAQFAELPDGCVLKVDLGPREEDLLVEYMRCLARDESLRRGIGTQARAYVHEQHTLERAAQGYGEFLRECAAAREALSGSAGIVTETADLLGAMVDGRHREHIRREVSGLLRDLALRRGLAPSGRWRTWLAAQLRRYGHYGRRLRDSYRRGGLSEAARFSADKAALRLWRLSAARKPRRGVLPRPGPVCREAFEEMCVLADGRVVCSCADSRAERVLGNLAVQRPYDVFNGPAYRQLRQTLISGRPPPMCLACPLRTRDLRPEDRQASRRVTSLQIEVTSLCNLRCPACVAVASRSGGAGGATMPFETFKRIVDDLRKDLRSVKFYNYGEPFLHKDCMRMLRCLKEASPRASVAISTNGTLVDRASQEDLVDLGIEVITFSIDGTAQAPYEKYRVGGRFEDAFNNMRGLVGFRRRRGAAKPFVMWQYILFEWNDSPDEIRLAKRMAVEAGVDCLLWVLTHTPGASQRLVPGAAGLRDLVSSDGLDLGHTRITWMTTVERRTDTDGYAAADKGYLKLWNELERRCGAGASSARSASRGKIA